MEGQAHEAFLELLLAIEEGDLLRDDGIRHGVVLGVEDGDQVEGQGEAGQAVHIVPEKVGTDRGVGRGDQVDHDLAGVHSGPEDQVAEGSLTSGLMVVGDPLFPEEGLAGSADGVHILRDNLAKGGGNNLIEMARPVEAQGQGTILDLIPKAVFHLVPVAFVERGPVDGDVQVQAGLLEEAADLASFEHEFRLIGQCLVDAAPAAVEVGAAGRGLQGGPAEEVQEEDFLGLPASPLALGSVDLTRDPPLGHDGAAMRPLVIIGVHLQEPVRLIFFDGLQLEAPGPVGVVHPVDYHIHVVLFARHYLSFLSSFI